MIRYKLIKPKYEGIIGFVVRLYNTIIYKIAEDEARRQKQVDRKRHYLIQVRDVLYLLSREDHLIAEKLTGQGFDFIIRMRYCRFYTDDRRKKKQA